MDKVRGRPSIRKMLEWAEGGTGVLWGSYHGLPLARWEPCRTRIVINFEVSRGAREHVGKFLELYGVEKIISVTTGRLK